MSETPPVLGYCDRLSVRPRGPASDFEYEVITDHLLHEEGRELLEGYRVVVTGTHPYYCTTRMLGALETHLGRGGRLVYLGGIAA